MLIHYTGIKCNNSITIRKATKTHTTVNFIFNRNCTYFNGIKCTTTFF